MKKRRLSDSSTDPAASQKHNANNGSGNLTLQSTDIAAALNEGESKSNDFRIKTEEMLSEVRLNYTRRGTLVEKLLHSVKEVIDAIPERLNQSVRYPAYTMIIYVEFTSRRRLPILKRK
jgi:hypothetical protein